MFMFSRRSCHWKVWTMPQPWRVWFDQLIWNKDTLKCLNSLERLVWSADTEYNQPIECLNSSESLVWSADMEYYQPKVSEQFRESGLMSWYGIHIINLKYQNSSESLVWSADKEYNQPIECLNSSESLVWSADTEYYQPKVSEQFRESCVISWYGI